MNYTKIFYACLLHAIQEADIHEPDDPTPENLLDVFMAVAREDFEAEHSSDDFDSVQQTEKMQKLALALVAVLYENYSEEGLEEAKTKMEKAIERMRD